MDHAVERILGAAYAREKGYVSVTGMHGVMEARRDDGFRKILNGSLLVTPDGMPTVWVGRMQGHSMMSRVYGPELMLQVCRSSVHAGLRHFFYGGNPGVAEELKNELISRFPGLQVVGTYTPPFRKLNQAEEQELTRLVSDSRPDIIWVGLSTPKQERFMAEYVSRLHTTLLVGVGAAFDIHTGRTTDAPEWIKVAGLQWFHRLLQEPRRLWKRYLLNIPRFLILIALQQAGVRSFPLQEPLSDC
jgi:N-acetylglucosaminyldiphosphoundecaprenol N-acetyl-beta-D-mannosaminyltransferase